VADVTAESRIEAREVPEVVSVKDIPKNMLKPRRARMAHGPGECWYYINASGLEVYVAEEPGQSSRHVIRFTKRQLEKALEIMGVKK
jgi:hypothetical protein